MDSELHGFGNRDSENYVPFVFLLLTRFSFVFFVCLGKMALKRCYEKD